MTPLMILAIYGHTRIAENFIKKGADVNLKNNDNCTALMFAAQQGYIETVALLIRYKANINEENIFGFTPLTYAILQGHVGIITYLIDHGADVNLPSGSLNITPLMYAAHQGLIQIATLLIKHGANINAQSSHKITSLMYAIFKDHAETTEYLITARADVNMKDFYGQTALTFCMTGGKKDFNHIIKLLISKGADFDISNSIHADALFQAFKRFIREIQELPYKLNILTVLLDFIRPDETNNFVVKTFTSGKRSFLFQQKRDDKINEDILIEDLSALKTAFISSSPLQDAVKIKV